MATNPYFTTPLAPARPRMFNTTVAKVSWTLVSIVTAGLAGAVPFVVAAVKGVIKPWLAAVYVVTEIVVYSVAIAISPSAHDDNPWPGFLMVLWIITAATHTSLLDNENVSVGK
ncbi:hypothetical protein AB0C13_40755 [Streptomyces sp. NPDC049099]|uniref:hypothetical protein n=1 Tax=Streptomyces sp. NPDC049099 TaxID=3155768 RepID=UPI003442CE35